MGSGKGNSKRVNAKVRVNKSAKNFVINNGTLINEVIQSYSDGDMYLDNTIRDSYHKMTAYTKRDINDNLHHMIEFDDIDYIRVDPLAVRGQDPWVIRTRQHGKLLSTEDHEVWFGHGFLTGCNTVPLNKMLYAIGKITEAVVTGKQTAFASCKISSHDDKKGNDRSLLNKQYLNFQLYPDLTTKELKVDVGINNSSNPDSFLSDITITPDHLKSFRDYAHKIEIVEDMINKGLVPVNVTPLNAASSITNSSQTMPEEVPLKTNKPLPPKKINPDTPINF